MNGEDRPQWLLDGYCSGSLSDEEFAEFEAHLRSDESLRHRLIKYRMLEADLRDHAQTEVHVASRAESNQVNWKFVRCLRLEILTMAAVIAVLLMAVVIMAVRDSGEELTVEKSTPGLDAGVAVLTREINARWENREVRLGDAMPKGLWRLSSGTAEIDFYSGASVILEAPAALEILSENRGILHAGRLRAHVPHHAHGFTIATQSVELVDIGTSFGMEIGADAETSVHVFDGEVELYEPESDRQRGKGETLLAGEGRRFTLSGDTVPIEADGTRFMTPANFREQARALEREKYQRWHRDSGQMEKDPRLVAQYQFEEGTGRALIGRFGSDFDGLHGAVIGARWSEGRWPDKGALDFKRPSDRVRIEVPESMESMTLVTWVRVDGLDNAFNSLLLSDGWDRPGAVHWQILNTGEVELAVWHGERTTKNSRAPFVISPFDFGQWVQLAVVYDGNAGTVSHYRDGQLSGIVELPAVVPLSIGKAEIGNWTPTQDKARQVRQFNGRIDELLIFNTAFSDTEIHTLYQYGKP